MEVDMARTVSANTAENSREGPPDVRGPTAPLPASILGAGAAALVAVIGGTIAVQVAHAMKGGPVSPTCIANLFPGSPTSPGSGGALLAKLEGGRNVCHIADALRSTEQTTLFFLAIALGVGAAIAGFAMHRRMDTKRKREHCLTGAVLGIQAVIVAAVLMGFRAGNPDNFALQFLNFVKLKGYGFAFLRGAKNTLQLALVGEIGGVVLGLILALFVLSDRRAVRAPARVYINFFRGTPLLWQLATFYFGFALGLQIKLSAYQTAMIVFALNTAAYAAEVFRAGIQSIERGQMEAARSLGMSYLQAMRYAIVPQAVRRVIPPLMNEFVILIKDTSLILVLGLTASEFDILTVARTGYSDTFNATFFVAAAVGYLAITLPLIRAVNAVERRLRSGLVGITAGA
jgi:His/Glu/Gln/Arg/opine family amino acid ABC transporter permease subunit